MSEPANSRAELDQLLEKFGGPIEEFRSSPGNLLAGLILGVLLFFGGAYSAVWVWPLISLTDMSQMVGALILLAATILITLGGVWLSYWSVSMFSYRVIICPGGVIEVIRGRPKAFRWEDVQGVAEAFDANVEATQNSTGKRATYIVYLKTGEKRQFDANRVKSIKLFRDRLVDEIQKRGIPWKRITEKDNLGILWDTKIIKEETGP